MTPPKLRERKKQRTREALIEAAHLLFCTRGFDATTIDQIAEAVEVSSRTFFRYFASKEDVALALADEQITAMLRAFADQAPDVPVLAGLRRAAVDTVRAYEAEAGRYQRLRALIASSPALTAARIERSTARIGEVTALVAARMRADPVTDPRPALLASVVVGAVPAALDAWRAAGSDAPDSVLLEQAFDLLAAGIDHPVAAEARPAS